MKAKRLQVRVFQRDLAKTIGVHIATLKDWEGNVGAPATGHVPAVIRFLGYVPFEHDGTRGGKVRWLRTCAGLSKKELSTLVGCEEGTIWRWENNQACEEGRWDRGLVAIKERLAKLGLSELTADVVQSLHKE